MNVALEAKPDVSTTKPDTYVIINGVRKRVTDDVSVRRHQQRERTNAVVTYNEGMHKSKSCHMACNEVQF